MNKISAKNAHETTLVSLQAPPSRVVAPLLLLARRLVLGEHLLVRLLRVVDRRRLLCLNARVDLGLYKSGRRRGSASPAVIYGGCDGGCAVAARVVTRTWISLAALNMPPVFSNLGDIISEI